MNKKIEFWMKKIKKEKLVSRYAILLSMLFLSAINYNIFLRPLKIVAGGTNGLSIVVEEIFSLEPSSFILYFQMVTLILAYFLIGAKKASSALIATFVYPFFVEITRGFCASIVVDASDIVVASIFSGVLSGVVSGLICKVDLSQGGIILLGQILFEKFRLSISKCNFVMNLIIVLFGGVCFGIDSILCAIILLYVSSVVLDRVMLGVSSHKAFYVITNQDEEIKKYVIDVLKSDVTVFNVKSGFHNDERNALFIVVPNDLYYKVKKRIRSMDSHAFFVTVDSYQVVGGHKA